MIYDERIVARLFAKVTEAKVTKGDTGCWVYQGQKTKGGYGTLWVYGKDVYTHRLAYELLRADIPEGLHIDHLCRNRACCNPWHLEPVTNAVNSRRGNSFTSVNAAKTHCPRGHLLSGENLLPAALPRRYCRPCKRLTDAIRRAK
jgi:hypothetical protein